MVVRPTVQRGRSGFDERGRGEVIYGERSNQRERTALSRPDARWSRPVSRQLRSLYCSFESRTTMKREEKNERASQGTGHPKRRSPLGLRLRRHYAQWPLFFLLPSPSNVSMPQSASSYERRMSEIGVNHGRKFCIGGSALNDQLRPFQS